MIGIRHSGTGEEQIIDPASKPGYGPEWEQLGPALPDSLAPETATFVDGAWQDNLGVLRSRKWGEVKVQRDRAEWGGCDTSAGRIDTDPDSQRKLSGAVQMAMLAQMAGQPFVIDWTMHDNSTLPHDADAMIAMGVAVGMHVSACHAVATALRAAIGASISAGDIAAVDVESGWPG